ncbi:unnamed protein product [Nyctereutes procyonoides]|uniref:(raccoon dog) hypothetical protein n=1 Tax=Nyctereutes procyonoides TaxID=34880 RepID=A0A811Z596_NYCPR|nr:unnamed protein product [Nyctereutes procyonoides]
MYHSLPFCFSQWPSLEQGEIQFLMVPWKYHGLPLKVLGCQPDPRSHQEAVGCLATLALGPGVLQEVQSLLLVLLTMVTCGALPGLLFQLLLWHLPTTEA